MIIKSVEHLHAVMEKEGNHKTFTYKGYDCEILRMPHMGHLCGYIHFTKGHMLFGMDYNDINAKYYYDLPSHGELTYSQLDTDKGTWRVGFDAAHAFDIVPVSYEIQGRAIGRSKCRTMDYIEERIKEVVDFIEAQKAVSGH